MRLYNNNCLSSEICKISFWFCAVVCSFTRTQCDLSCRKQTLKKEFHDNVIKLIDNIKEVLNCHKIFGSKYGLWILKLYVAIHQIRNYQIRSFKIFSEKIKYYKKYS